MTLNRDYRPIRDGTWIYFTQSPQDKVRIEEAFSSGQTFSNGLIRYIFTTRWAFRFQLDASFWCRASTWCVSQSSLPVCGHPNSSHAQKPSLGACASVSYGILIGPGVHHWKRVQTGGFQDGSAKELDLKVEQASCFVSELFCATTLLCRA